MKRLPSLPPLVLVALLATWLVGLAAAEIVVVQVAPEEDDTGPGVRAQSRSACFFAYGLEQETGHLYRIDLGSDFGLRRAPTLIAEPAEELALTAPNGLAYDALDDRLYFAEPAEGGGSVLYVYDRDEDRFWRAGDVSGSVAGATFHDRGYYYVDQGTDDLRRVFLEDDGTVFAESSVAEFGLDGGLAIEDVAVHDGILYGSTSSEGEGLSARFFTYDLARDEFRTISTSSATYLQLAFAVDRGLVRLFGSSAHDGVFYGIDHLPWGGGATASRFTEPGVLFSDLAEGPMC